MAPTTTYFQPRVTNMQYNATQNITGMFQNSDGEAAVCPSGFLCTRKSLLPNSGYPGILNGNAWYMEAAESGAPAGAIPHIYAFNSYDVNMASQGKNNWMVGANTLGLSLPEGVPGTFTEIIENEQYLFGPGCFSTAPTDITTTKYVTIADGMLVASATAPAAGTGLWFEILMAETPTEGTMAAATGWRLLAHYTGGTAAAG